MPRCGFSGLPGETSSQTWSSRSRAARQFDDVAMACMRRIERTAEQADAHAPPVAEARDRLMPSGVFRDAPARCR